MITITGWTLLHFVWQGTLVALTAAAAMWLLRHRSSHLRYTVACAALAVMLIAPAITARAVAQVGNASAASPRSMIAAPVGDSVPGAPTQGTTANEPYVASGFLSDVASGFLSYVGSGFSRTIDVNTLLPIVVAFWIGGVAILFLQLAGGWWRVRELQAVALAAPASRWDEAGRRIAAQLGLARALRIVDSHFVESPTVIGWMRPVVLLPIAALANLTPGQVEAILAHELAHIRRHDFIVNVLQTMAETLLFYHPAVWWLSRRIRLEREQCCDDIAVEVCGDAYGYAAALTEIAAIGVSRPPLALTATGGALVHRVRRLLGAQGAGHRHPASAGIVGGLALTLVVVAGGMQLFSQPADPGPATPSRFGPADLNRLLGFELLPGRAQYPGDDPRDARAWSARVAAPSVEMLMIGSTARSLIRSAYGLVGTPIAGAPAWMDHETFDIVIPSDTDITFEGRSDSERVNDAIRAFLENQLNLSWHFETRDFPVYALVRAHADGTLGPNIRPAGWCTFLCGVDNDLFGLSARRVTMDEFVREMRRAVSPLTVGRDIVDRTGLSGAFDFELKLGLLPLAAIAQRSPVAGAILYPAGIRSIFTALPQQLGLKLEESTEARQVLVIDHIDRPSTP